MYQDCMINYQTSQTLKVACINVMCHLSLHFICHHFTMKVNPNYVINISFYVQKLFDVFLKNMDTSISGQRNRT